MLGVVRGIHSCHAFPKFLEYDQMIKVHIEKIATKHPLSKKCHSMYLRFCKTEKYNIVPSPPFRFAYGCINALVPYFTQQENRNFFYCLMYMTFRLSLMVENSNGLIVIHSSLNLM